MVRTGEELPDGAAQISAPGLQSLLCPAALAAEVGAGLEAIDTTAVFEDLTGQILFPPMSA